MRHCRLSRRTSDRRCHLRLRPSRRPPFRNISLRNPGRSHHQCPVRRLLPDHPRSRADGPRLPGAKLISAFFFFGAGQLMTTEPPTLVHFELRLLRFEGLSPLTQHRRRSPLRPSVPTRDAGYDRCWHETDMPTALRDVRSRGQSGKHILAVSFSVFGPTRTLQSLGWSNCLFRPRPHEVSFVGLSNIRVNGVSVLEVRIVFGRSSTLVSNQARCIQVAA